MPQPIATPVLAPGTRYRWDKVRNQHQLVFPEGMIVLNEPGKAIVQLCDGRITDELIAVLKEKYPRRGARRRRARVSRPPGEAGAGARGSPA